jgi:D-3-phosphoglycerate dehydrogenase
MNDHHARSVGIRYYGELAESRTEMIVNSVLAGLFKPILWTAVTAVNARSIAAERGIEVTESRSTRARDYTSLISVKLQTNEGERWVEGAVFERASTASRMVDGVGIEAPLEGTMIVICNTDQPGVIGDVGTILGRHGVNIGTFALGRDGDRAVGVVIVDETAPIPEEVLEELRRVKAIREVRLVRV